MREREENKERERGTNSVQIEKHISERRERKWCSSWNKSHQLIGSWVGEHFHTEQQGKSCAKDVESTRNSNHVASLKRRTTTMAKRGESMGWHKRRNYPFQLWPLLFIFYFFHFIFLPASFTHDSHFSFSFVGGSHFIFVKGTTAVGSHRWSSSSKRRRTSNEGSKGGSIYLCMDTIDAE